MRRTLHVINVLPLWHNTGKVCLGQKAGLEWRKEIRFVIVAKSNSFTSRPMKETTDISHLNIYETSYKSWEKQ